MPSVSFCFFVWPELACREMTTARREPDQNGAVAPGLLSAIAYMPICDAMVVVSRLMAVVVLRVQFRILVPHTYGSARSLSVLIPFLLCEQ